MPDKSRVEDGSDKLCVEDGSDGVYIKDDMMAATGFLLVISNGEIVRACTAPAFEREPNDIYRFFVMAHCVASLDEKTSLTIPFPDDFSYVIVFNRGGEIQSAYLASVLAIGDMSQPMRDLAILEAKIDRYIPVIPLGQRAPVLGEKVSLVTPANEYVANGFIMNEFYTGFVTLDEIRIDYFASNGENFKGSFKIQLNDLGSANGASGSAVVSHDQNAMVGLIVASIKNDMGGIGLAAIPITEINEFNREFKQGKYKIHKEDKSTRFEASEN